MKSLIGEKNIIKCAYFIDIISKILLVIIRYYINNIFGRLLILLIVIDL